MSELSPPVIDLDRIADAGARRAIRGLLNLVEALLAETRAVRAENQRLRDEINRLKGAPGRPPITANKHPAPRSDHSSERERHRPTPRPVPGKLRHLVIHRTEDLPVDPALLPPGAAFKGYAPVVAQDVIFRTDKVLFRKETWYSPSAGQSYVAPLLELGAGFHAELTGRENVYLNGVLLGHTTAAMDRLFDGIVEFAEVGEFIDAPLRTYSTGMVARLGFAVATAVPLDILIVDEVLSVGDRAFQAKCAARLDAFHRQGATILLVSHSPELVGELCDRAAWFDHG